MRRTANRPEKKQEAMITLRLALSAERKRPVGNLSLEQNDHARRREDITIVGLMDQVLVRDPYIGTINGG